MRKILHQLITVTFLMATLMVLPGFAAIAETDDGSITGIVVADSNSTPVSFASVALLSSSDSSLISGVITDDQGRFQFNNLPYGEYSIKVSFVGYKPVTIKKIEVSRQNKVVDLAQAKLVEDYKKLDDVTIIGQRLKGEEKVDRTVFTLNDDVRKASTNALDALKHIPSVSVDFQNNVTLAGQSNIQFYVDGVLRNKEFVQQIKPDRIDKIELITNPGVSYDADVSGVINIVLKKEKRTGMSGSIKVPFPSPKKIVAEPGANLEFGNQRFRIYAGDQMHYERFSGSEKLTTKVDDQVVEPYKFERNSHGTNSWQNNYMNYGIDWFINDKTSLNFLGEWRNWKGVNDNYKTDSKLYTSDTLTDYFKTSRNSTDKNNNYYFSLYFLRKFNKEGDQIKAEGYFNTEKGLSNNNYLDTYINLEDMTSITSKDSRMDLTNNLRQNAEFKLDATFMLKNIKNEVGVRTYGAYIKNTFTTENNIENNPDIQIEDFKYRETRQTAYYNLSGKIKKFTWQTGLRGEYTWMNINSTNNPDYTVLLPQVSLNQGLPKDQSLNFTYRKQIYRPQISDINPFIVWTDSLHARIGNPDLKPAIENRLELSYSKNFKSNYFSPKVYYRFTNNGIQDITSITPEGATLITQGNIGKNIEYGISINTAIQIMKRWRFNANVDIFDRIYRTNEVASENSRQEKASYRFNFSHIISLPKDYTLYMFANYGSPNITYQREFYRDFLYLFGGSKKISDKWTVDVLYNPFINKFKYSKVITTAPGYYESWEGYVNVSQLFCFNVTYNFNIGNKINKLDRSADYERNEGKGGL